MLLTHNLVAVLRDPDIARQLLRRWERIQPAEAGVGFVAMASPATSGRGADHRLDVAETDPEKVTGHTGRKVLRGGIPGALIGAVVIAAIAAILTSDVGNVIGAALGGAAIGFVAGAFFSFVSGTGWSKAYEESFVEPGATDLSVASIHSDDVAIITEARRVAHLAGDTLLSVDRHGQPVPLDGGDGRNEGG